MSVSALGTQLSPIPSVGLLVCLSVGPERVLCQNGRLDPDAVRDGGWGRSRDGCIRRGGDRRREGAVLRVKVISEDGDALFPNYFEEDLFSLFVATLAVREGADP